MSLAGEGEKWGAGMGGHGHRVIVEEGRVFHVQRMGTGTLGSEVEECVRAGVQAVKLHLFLPPSYGESIKGNSKKPYEVLMDIFAGRNGNSKST